MVQSINPYTQEVIQSFTLHTQAEIELILQNAQKAFLGWQSTEVSEKTALLGKISYLLKEKKQELAKRISQEMGKPLQEAIAEIEKCSFACDYYKNVAKQYLQPTHTATEAKESRILYEPLGVILGIMPWNFPFWQVFRFAIPCLVAGNTVLLKHAPNVWGCAEAIEQLFREAGFEQGIFQILKIQVEEVEKVIASPVVKAVSFTGSTQAGSKVAQLASKYLKKSVLELGGSDAFIVLPDADLEKASQVAVQSRMLNTGQSCIAAKRFLVEKSVYHTFLQLLLEKIKMLRTGNPLEINTQIGVLARPDLADKAEQQLRQSIALGAKLLTGGVRQNNFFAPTLLADVTPEMPVFQEEVFAPIAAVMPFDNIQEAIHLANQSPYGLAATLWTSNTNKAKEWAKQLEVGCVTINNLTKSDPRMPFGGVKQSGFGRELSYFGIYEFCNIKSLWLY
ncbi:MAG: NAD-dependent succinate-semialdehyde dehydrogenase [Microscillaceae bacterium]|nr:NAD-dependent succinate-semialdehyde dehydrogenase [Microscillaceae bacterium]MDW8459863.1 NAD-dependent succinate-semialdehyde dehydrogenase [Cytophagales bacterium]